MGNDLDRRSFVGLAAAALASRGFQRFPMLQAWQQLLRPVGPRVVTDELSALGDATAWINTPALNATALKGKVVLVQFWTFTCINWLRTLPYVRSWAHTYQSGGLVVIGVHTPEFPFEHSLDNVRRATAEMTVDYPVAVDNDYAIWRGFNNEYWPALYLVDAKGRVRYHQFGEGAYAESERMIQQLLTEAGAPKVSNVVSTVDGRGIEAAADWADLRSGENYVGYERTEGFASPGGIARGRARSYSLPRELQLNQWGLEGEWTIEKGSMAPSEPNGKIAYRFHARDLHLVMGPPSKAKPVRFRALLDGQSAGAVHGADIDGQGSGVATTQRLYQLIRQPQPIVDRVFQIEFLDPGVEIFSFTFG